MTHQEIKELAGHRDVPPWVVKLVGDAVAREREDCANICDEANKRFQDLWKRFEYEIDMGAELGTYQCAKAIRERGQA